MTQARVKIGMTVLILSLALSACGAKGNDTDGPQTTPPPTISTPEPSASVSVPPGEDRGDLIVNEFREMALAGAPAKEMFDSFRSSVAEVQPTQADELVREMEAYYETNLPETEKAFEDSGVQQALMQLEWPISEQAIEDMTDDEVKELAEETLAGGYKLETAEGYIFPVVDYGRLLSFGDRVSIAMKAYLELMAAESDAPAAKDAALVISWDELASRALAAESFVVTFPDTPERAEAERRFLLYLQFYLIGLNNTPIFDYETFELLPEVKAQYEQMAASHAGTITGQLTAEWLNALEEANGQVFGRGANGEQTDIPALKEFRDSLETKARDMLPAAKNE
ncbi:hypothetical protein ACF3MZ_01100 [Paenibacillaceae bacterium WGS1546]|uniref:hypothetical protein n=1 Tax=Cohnella sp. WGS1546 TaxID=3366810 RepID=UPI00372CF049